MTNSLKYRFCESIFFKQDVSKVQFDRVATLADVKAEITIIVDTITFDTVVAVICLWVSLKLNCKVAVLLYPAKNDQNGNHTSQL
jgi:hypothetical protein